MREKLLAILSIMVALFIIIQATIITNNFKEEVVENQETIEEKIIQKQEKEMFEIELIDKTKMIQQLEEKQINIETELLSRSGQINVMSLPSVPGDKKTFMGFDAIQNKLSKQWYLQQVATTDENGFRRIGIYYLVALGTFYAKNIGDTFTITFEDGSQIQIMVGDVKANEHTDINNQYTLHDGSIVEFIVDKSKISDKIHSSGSCASVIGEGKVIEIRKNN